MRITKESNYLISNGCILKISTAEVGKNKQGKSIRRTDGIIKGMEGQGYFWLENDSDGPVVSASCNTSEFEHIFKNNAQEIEDCFIKYFNGR